MRFENMESKMVYTIRGKCSAYYASRVSDFFVIFFLRAEDGAEGFKSRVRLFFHFRMRHNVNTQFVEQI